MSQYYNANRKRNLYSPQDKAFRLSRSKIDLFLNCPRCFYLDRKLGVAQPPGYPFSLNSAVDTLLKKEFDIHRAKGTRHPFMEERGIEALPYAHEKLDEWRDSLRRGITAPLEGTNLLITGGVDDVWRHENGDLHIVDYKATSKDGEVSLDAPWQIGYKRQMEIYQWLFRQNNFNVSNTGYFVYCNGDTSKDAFGATLSFAIKIIPYEGNDAWVKGVIMQAYQCLNEAKPPQANADCDYCSYRKAAQEVEV